MSETTVTKPTKPKNPFRISIAKLAETHGYFDLTDFLTEKCNDSVVPAMCIEGCDVEPDGYCCHGCPSPLMALGII